MRDDADGAVCVVPCEDDAGTDDHVLRCPPAAAVAVADGLSGPGVWAPHPTLRVADRAVAVAVSDVARTVVAAVNLGTPVEAALKLTDGSSPELIRAA